MVFSLFLVDDDELVRAGIRLLVERVPDVHVVGEAADGREALPMIERLQPNVVLTDICMPFLDGIGLTREVQHRYPGVAVVIVTAHSDQQYLIDALHAGAAGYILKSSGPTELEIAIRAAAKGDVYVTPRMAKPLLSERFIPTSKPSAFRRNHLTQRQRQTLHLIAAGKTNKEIATSLDLTVKTVEKHRTELMHRLGVHTAVELLRCALQNDLV